MVGNSQETQVTHPVIELMLVTKLCITTYNNTYVLYVL